MKIQRLLHRGSRTLLAGLLSCVMIVSLFGAITVAAAENEEDTEYAAGVVVTPVSEEDLAGEYGTAYAITGYKATFTFLEEETNPITGVAAFGDFLWCDREEVEALAYEGYENEIADVYTAYEIYEEDMVQYITMTFYDYEEVSDGVWQLEMPIFPGEYMYWLIIDYEDGSQDFRVVDPGNPDTKYVENDSISFLYVGSADDAGEAQEYIYPVEDESDAGTIISTSVVATNGAEQALSIYLPADYDVNTTYKTLYLLHGMEEKDTTWLTGVSAANILDNLIAEGELESTIVVMMNNSVFDDINTWDGAVTVLENLIEVVLPYVEANYNVSADASDRAVAGYSAGGNQTVYAIDAYTEYFKYYGVFSAGDEYVFAEDSDFSDIVVYLAAGNLETGEGGGNITGIMTHYNNLTALGATASCDLVDGNHYYRAWREAATTFLKDILWCEEEADEAYEGGVVVTNVSAEDLAGEYGTAYAITGYKATFTYIAESDAEHGDVVGAAVFGDFLWVDRDDVAAWQEGGCEEDPVYYKAYEIYEDDMVQYVTFDFYPMEKVSGTANVYQVSFPVFASEYMYWLRITYEDGTTVQAADPANNSTQYTEEDSVSFLYVGDAASAGEAQEYIYPVEDENVQGTIVSTSVTATNGEEQSLSIYLPAGYDDSTTYKSLYVLHGADETDKVWLTGTSLANIMDHLIADGEVEPTVVIMMDNSIYETSDYYSVLNEIVGVILPYVEANYSVSTNPEERAIAGISAGGHEVQIAIDEYTEYFQYYGSFSAYYEHDLPEDVDYSDLIIYLSYGNLEENSLVITEVGELYAEEDATVTVDIVDGNHYYRAWREAFATFVKDVLWSEYWSHGALILY